MTLDRPPDQAPTILYDCVVISDLHLGSVVCQAKLLEEFIEWVSLRSRELVINGDIFDDLNFSRLSKKHFAVLRSIRRHSDRVDFRLIWIRGNHDGPADVVGHIVGVEIKEEYVFENDHVRLLILHGDQFDQFITKYKYITTVACGIYYFIQKLAPHRAARWIRRVSKKWQRNSQLVERGAVEYAKSKGCDAVTCGHTHMPMIADIEGVRYVNSGTWTEFPPCPFVTVAAGKIQLEWWPIPDEPHPESSPLHVEEPESSPWSSVGEPSS